MDAVNMEGSEFFIRDEIVQVIMDDDSVRGVWGLGKVNGQSSFMLDDGSGVYEVKVTFRRKSQTGGPRIATG